MKKITKSLMTLALLVLGVTSASADKRVLVKDFDFSTGGYNFYTHTDFAKQLTVSDGGLQIVSPVEGVSGDKAFFVADWMIPDKGANYVAVFTYTSTVAGTANLSMDPWGTGASSRVTLEVSDEFTTAEALFENYPVEGHNNQYGGDTHIIMNIGSLEGTIILKKVEVYQVIPDAPQASTGQNGWLENIMINPDFTGTDFSCYQAKDYIDETNNGNVTNPVIEDGAIVVTNNQVKTPKMDGDEQAKDQWGNLLWNEDGWNCQFWIVLPEKLSVGSKFYLTFDYKAKAAGKASTQAHATPGAYKHYACIGDINFSTEWKTFAQEVTVGNEWTDDFQSIAFNLNEDVDANVYYFKNISVQLPNIVESVALTAGPARWASFSWSKPVSLVNAKAGYAVELKDTWVNLIPVETVPANTAVLIEAKEGEGIIQLPVIDEGQAEEIAVNDLLISDGTVTGGETIYALANGDKGIGFYKVDASVTIPAGKGYLNTGTATGRTFIGFTAEATGITNVKADKNSSVIYNLAGQRIVKAQKGLYIQNGKKYIK